MNICSSSSKMEDRKVFLDLIEEHFSNNAIQQEELENFMIVWDSKENKWKKLFEINEVFYYEEFGCDHAIRFKYEENRYFRKEIK